MAKKKKITVVIPALNEEEAVASVIKEVPISKIKAMGYDVEIMIVDNGSTDKTGHIAKKNGATVFVQPVRGYGNAYKAGFANSHGDIIITGDADCTYPFEDIPKFLKIIEKENIDFISTDRLTNLRPGVMHWTHQFGNWFLATICRCLWRGFPFHDSQSGMWIFKKKIWSKLNVKASGMPFSQALKIEAFQKGFKCKEVPIDYRVRVGEVKLDGWKDAVKNTVHLFVKRLGLMGF
ncbi:glycosyltransferase family 2 protein [Candidatus Pacearchaeota archaeon]|nr:glycosyltransferase family 2 protein [Candidatus Pacearchaeota archaeon]